VSQKSLNQDPSDQKLGTSDTISTMADSSLVPASALSAGALGTEGPMFVSASPAAAAVAGPSTSYTGATTRAHHLTVTSIQSIDPRRELIGDNLYVVINGSRITPPSRVSKGDPVQLMDPGNPSHSIVANNYVPLTPKANISLWENDVPGDDLVGDIKNYSHINKGRFTLDFKGSYQPFPLSPFAPETYDIRVTFLAR
jgi:hypothetical protein